MRIFVPAYFVTYFVVCFVWRWIAFRRLTGKNPIILGDSSTPHGYLGFWLKVIVIVVGAEVLTFAAFPAVFTDGLLKSWPMPDWAMAVGVALWIFALIITSVAQVQMGRSWRVGFNTDEKTEIIKTGFFHYSRNPIYVGMMMSVLGLFMILPNTLSLILLILGYVLLQITVRLEESHLLALHGEPYREYLKRVRRWI